MRKIITAFTLGTVFCGCGSDGASPARPGQIEVLVDTGTRTKTVVAEVIGDNVLIEGDILLGKTYEMTPDKPLSINWKDLGTRWDGAKVRYAFEDGLPTSQQQAFEGAVATLEKITNLDFVEDDDCSGMANMIVVKRAEDTESNSSKVGMVGGCQSLYLRDDAGPASARHELGHALGMPHEHARPDRDQHVQVCWDNIIAGREDNFVKKDPNEVDLLSDYDVTSIMHYGRMNQSIFSLDDPDGNFLPDLPAMRLLNDPFQCWEEVPSGPLQPPPMGSGGIYTSEDHNALLLMYAKPLDVPESDDSMGSAMALGFLDGDGWRDLVVGAPRESVPGIQYEGAAFVYKGTKKHPAPWKMLRASPSPGTKALFGSSIAIGDFDGDGMRDLAIGAPGATHDGVNGGAVYIFRFDNGGFTQMHRLQAKHTASSSPDVSGDRFGAALAAGDLNGDGRAELLVGAPGRGGRGRVHVFMGTQFFGAQQPIANSPLDQPSPQVSSANFGASIVIGDVTPSPAPDVIVGAPQGGTVFGGAVHVFKGSGGFPVHYKRVEQTSGATTMDEFGSSIAVATMGAPTQSLLIGAPNKLKAQSNTRTGAVFLFEHAVGAERFEFVTASFPGDAGVQRYGHALATVALGGITESVVVTAPKFLAGQGRAVILKRQGNSLPKTHDLASAGISDFGTSVVTGWTDVWTTPPAQGFPESAQPPKVIIGAPGHALVGAAQYFTIGAVDTYYRHSVTQLSGSNWSEWAP
jgi:hypothetical protein